MTELMAQDEWRFLHADFRAAQWVLDTDPDAEPHVLLRKFFSIHQFFLRNIGRSRPELFEQISHDVMLDVVRKWIALYRRTLSELRREHPRRAGTADLRLAGVNWSERLGITFDGLLRGTSHASRYAEFWAERSLGCPRTRASFDARLRFVGAPSYREVFELRYAKKLVVVDRFVNALPTFDLIVASVGARDATELRSRFSANDWRVDALDDEAAAALIGGSIDAPAGRRCGEHVRSSAALVSSPARTDT